MTTFHDTDEAYYDIRFWIVLYSVVDSMLHFVDDLNLLHATDDQIHRGEFAQLVTDVKRRIINDIPEFENKNKL